MKTGPFCILEPMAELVGIWRSPKRREPMEPLEAARVFENEGVEGCAHRRGGKRNVLFVAAEDLEALDVEPGAVKENFTTRGADVMKWPVGQRLDASTIVVLDEGPAHARDLEFAPVADRAQVLVDAEHDQHELGHDPRE